MCELPANALLADELLEHFDERNPAVKELLSMAIHGWKVQGKYVGICRHGPSDHPDLAK